MSCAPEETAENLSASPTSTAAPRAEASRPPNWSRPRARSARGSCFPASGRAAACSPSAATGSIAAQYRTVEEELGLVAAVRVEDLMDVLDRYPLTSATTLTIGPLADVPPPGE